MKKIVWIILLCPCLSLAQKDEFKFIDSTYHSEYKAIQNAKSNNFNLLRLIDEREIFLLKSGRFILDQKPLNEYSAIIPDEYKTTFNTSELQNYEDVEFIQMGIDYFFKSAIINEHLSFKVKSEKLKVENVKDRLVKCLNKESISIIDFNKMTKSEKLPIQKRCFPEIHRK